MAEEKRKFDLTNADVHRKVDGLVALGQDPTTPFALAFRCTRNHRILEPLSKASYDVRENIGRAFAEKTEEGEPRQVELPGQAGTYMWDIPAEKQAKYNKAMREHMDEVNKDVELYMVHSAAFRGVKEIAGNILFAIFDMIEDPDKLEAMFPLEETKQ